MTKIVLKGNPLSTQHLYGISCRGNFAKRYMTAKGKALKKQYQWEAKSQWKGDPVFYPIVVKVRLYFGDKRKRDIDNHSKILYDSLTGIVWDDDNQIRKATTEIFCSKDNPRIEISILKYK